MYKPGTHFASVGHAQQSSGRSCDRQERAQSGDQQETNDCISALTLEILEKNLRDAREDDSVGAAMEIDGQFCFIEFDTNHRKHRVAFAKGLVEIAREHCCTTPDAASSPQASTELSAEVLSMEERELLLLAKECNATLLTADGRLRMLAEDGHLTSNLIIASR